MTAFSRGLATGRDEMPPEAVKQLQQICSDAISPKDSGLREALVEAREALDRAQREIFELVGYGEKEIDEAMSDFVTANQAFRAIDHALSSHDGAVARLTGI